MQKLSLALASRITSAASAVPKNGKPNILLLFTDALGRYASAYASPDQPSVNDIISTPTFDQLASEGVLATNAFVSAPSCSPCWASRTLPHPGGTLVLRRRGRIHF